MINFNKKWCFKQWVFYTFCPIFSNETFLSTRDQPFATILLTLTMILFSNEIYYFYSNKILRIEKS